MRPPSDPAAPVDDTESPRIAAHIIEHTRMLSLTTPPPRNNPYFGLDDLEPLQTGLLGELTAAGIFRKYEFVLGLGSAFGGAARWLALTRGCSVIGVTATPGEATAANLLTRRANLSGQVTAVPAAATQLPFVHDQFTHIWTVDALFREPDLDRVYEAVFHAVRPGGLLFSHETVLVAGAAAPGPGWNFRNIDAHADALRRAGFIDILVDDVSARRLAPAVTAETARAGLDRRIADAEGPACAYLRMRKEHAALAALRRQGILATANFVATRPAFRLGG